MLERDAGRAEVNKRNLPRSGLCFYVRVQKHILLSLLESIAVYVCERRRSMKNYIIFQPS